MSTFYLGLSTSGHDPALALVDEAGRLVFAEATERFVQDKRAWGIAPDHSPHLQHALDTIGFNAATDRLVVASSWSATKADVPVQVSNALLPGTEGLWLRSLQAQAQANAGASLLRLELVDSMPSPLRFDHHLCHAVNACYQSSMDDAVCLVIDGEGEVGAASLFDMADRRLKRRWRSWGPGSLGTFYAWLTMKCGFDWRLGEEWKVMGLAGFGNVIPELADSLAAMLSIENGRPKFNDQTLIDAACEAAARYGRGAGDPIMKAADLAASGQAAYARLADQVLTACARSGVRNLILSGGCALNSSYNGTIAAGSGFDTVFVPSAPADDGNAVGAAILAFMQETGTARIPSSDGSAFLGSQPSLKTLAKAVQAGGSAITSDLGGGSATVVADRLQRGHVIGVMRGRAEFGPRALGHRSILADPRPAGMKDRINEQIKGREAYRPFAPVVPAGKVADWFERSQSSPYMSFTLPWRQSQRSRVPAVVHADGTGRLQTVSRESNAWMSDLVDAFGLATGVPIVLNTSFNIMGKPIVHSVEDAMAVLMTSGLDSVLIEDVLIEKRRTRDDECK